MTSKMTKLLPIFRGLLNITRSSTPLTINSSFHTLNKASNLIQEQAVTNFLSPISCSVIPSCGFKVKGWLRKRCKDCYFVRREERLYVICKTHPRHKQMSMVKDPENTWILTHATMGKVRPW